MESMTRGQEVLLTVADGLRVIYEVPGVVTGGVEQGGSFGDAQSEQTQ